MTPLGSYVDEKTLIFDRISRVELTVGSQNRNMFFKQSFEMRSHLIPVHPSPNKPPSNIQPTDSLSLMQR